MIWPSVTHGTSNIFFRLWPVKKRDPRDYVGQRQIHQKYCSSIAFCRANKSIHFVHFFPAWSWPNTVICWMLSCWASRIRSLLLNATTTTTQPTPCSASAPPLYSSPEWRGRSNCRSEQKPPDHTARRERSHLASAPQPWQPPASSLSPRPSTIASSGNSSVRIWVRSPPSLDRRVDSERVRRTILGLGLSSDRILILGSNSGAVYMCCPN